MCSRFVQTGVALDEMRAALADGRPHPYGELVLVAQRAGYGPEDANRLVFCLASEAAVELESDPDGAPVLRLRR